MPARKWKTDPMTEGPRAGRRYWLTVNDGEEHYVLTARWDGMTWRDVCGMRNGLGHEQLPAITLAWMQQPDAPDPWVHSDFPDPDKA